MKPIVPPIVATSVALLILAAMSYAAYADFKGKPFLSSASVATGCIIAFVGPLALRAVSCCFLLGGMNEAGYWFEALKWVLPAAGLLYAAAHVIQISPSRASWSGLAMLVVPLAMLAVTIPAISTRIAKYMPA